MDERIVVCLAVQGPHPAEYAQRVDSLVKRASAFGATVCACGWDGIAFAFHPDDVEEAIEFARASDVRQLTAPFCVGIAGGGWTALLEASSSIELGFGPALFRARAVAALARNGEVLLETSLQQGHHFLLASPDERSAQAPLPIRAVALAPPSDPASDGRSLPVQLEPSELVSREVTLDLCSGDPGTLATLRAVPGVGGTRVLQACAIAVAPASTLLLRPVGAGVEPLGSLRRAFGREVALHRSRPVPDVSAATLAALLDGRGATIDAAAALLEDWLAGSSPGLLLIDDATEVDPTSLEVVANSLIAASRPFRAIARLDAESPLPAVLALAAPGPEITIGPLMPGDAESIASSWLGCVIDDDMLRKLVASADGVPLTLRERLADAIGTADLQRSGGKARMRAGFSLAPADGSVRPAITDRLNRVTPGGRAVLLAVAMLGGDVSDEQAASLVESAADVPTEFTDELRELVAAGWIVEPEPGWVALPSRSHQRVLVASLPEDRRGSWHRAAALTLEMHATGLAYADAAWHAAMAGDDRRASRLARQTAAVAHDAQLEAAAKALEMLSASPVHWTPEADSSPGLGGPRAPMMTIPPSPEQELAARLVAHGAPPNASDSYLPVDLPERAAATQPDAAPRPSPPAIPRAPRPADVAKLGARTPAPVAVPRPAGAVERERTEQHAAAPAPMPTQEPTQPVIAAAPVMDVRAAFASVPSAHVEEMAGSLPLIAREALASGNEEVLERWFEDLGAAGKSPRLVERMRAIATLPGRNSGAAIATLREACVRAQSLGEVERSRSHLALAVGLARIGRLTEALIEGLEALSRARQAADAHAERACLRFLQQLYAAAGQPAGAFSAPLAGA